MKEKLEYFLNSFKNGIVLWIISYLLLYAVGLYIGDVSAYNVEVMKLLDVNNFIMQLVIVGFTYVALDLAFTYYFNNIVKIVGLKVDSKKELLKEIIAIVVIFVVVLPILEVVKEHDIVNKNIIKIMVSVMIMKAIVFGIVQTIRSEMYNKKLQEKNKN